MTLHTLVGTTSGNTEYLAEQLNQWLETKGVSTQLHDYPNIQEVPLSQSAWLVCVATHGAGEYAESIDQFMQDLANQKPDLSTVKVAVLSIGDSSYDTFCQAGIDAQSLFENLGAQIVGERLDIDMMLDPDPEVSAQAWLATLYDRLI
ncbi:flavodoxin domain-containing protein [Aliidiomarina maris]|uniref:MioC protein n=1 Tax=Aliidiomarina maris TaxID=531312 RepID=A0A327WX39_9GAMM|nr:flavodoxin domain-containing protein [Aliidiomarina maris]MBA3987841.1 hypothetical protein [Idiomarina sp.]MCL5050738.1 flavodoxin domain-containing protein [Bacillota bacterium]RAJ97060.1 MioC protein [Aliidiomarina maris]RUO24664.1 hypothetical protein CWE07_08325 [Aliidiomarina maris]